LAGLERGGHPKEKNQDRQDFTEPHPRLKGYSFFQTHKHEKSTKKEKKTSVLSLAQKIKATNAKFVNSQTFIKTPTKHASGNKNQSSGRKKGPKVSSKTHRGGPATVKLEKKKGAGKRQGPPPRKRKQKSTLKLLADCGRERFVKARPQGGNVRKKEGEEEGKGGWRGAKRAVGGVQPQT